MVNVRWVISPLDRLVHVVFGVPDGEAITAVCDQHMAADRARLLDTAPPTCYPCEQCRRIFINTQGGRNLPA